MAAFARMADEGWRAGWHERNGGNLSYRLSAADIEVLLPFAFEGPWCALPQVESAVAGEWFLITAAGSFFQNISRDFERCAGVIEVDAAGENYRIRWGFAAGARPTSELATHLRAHGVRMRATGGKSRVLYHCHPANIVALTFVLPLDSAIFTRYLWEMISECAMIFPEGVAVVDWMVPGGTELACASCAELERVKTVVWPHHGIFCTEDTFDLTFGLMHTIEKAAEILVKVISMGGFAEDINTGAPQIISKRNLCDLAKAYNLELNQEALNIR
jgi:rhamnulose-1-phosphate aldolase